MRLIGMLDSPYVRRVAISLQLLGLPFRHESLSVFRTYDRFRAINPVVKAPTLVCEDGTVLMDSALILDYAEALARPACTLLPATLPALRRELRLAGLALAGCDKAVQHYYELTQRPPERRHAPWLDRVTAQMRAAFGELERELAHQPLPAASSAELTQAGITAAVVWHFVQSTLPGVVDAAAHPALAAHSARAEALPEFRAAPHSGGTAHVSGSAA